MKIVFLAVNYNNYAITANYVNSVNCLRDVERHRVGIVVVDNASRPEDIAGLRRTIGDAPRTKIVCSRRNLGYFGGLNYGIRSLRSLDFDYLVAGNNDLIFDRDFLRTLAEKSYSNRQMVIAPDLVTPSGVHQNPQFTEPPSLLRRMGYRLYYTAYPAAMLTDLAITFPRILRTQTRRTKLETAMEIYMCTGACMIFRPLFFRRCGLLDESVFLWGEEVLLARQLERAGCELFYDPELRVLHIENATTRRIPPDTRYQLLRRSYMAYRDSYRKGALPRAVPG